MNAPASDIVTVVADIAKLRAENAALARRCEQLQVALDDMTKWAAAFAKGAGEYSAVMNSPRMKRAIAALKDEP